MNLIDIEIYTEHADQVEDAIRDVAMAVVEGYGAGTIAPDIEYGGDVLGFWSSNEKTLEPGIFIIRIEFFAGMADLEIASAITKIADQYKASDHGMVSIMGIEAATYKTLRN